MLHELKVEGQAHIPVKVNDFSSLQKSKGETATEYRDAFTVLLF
mgnify:CR=1 FL=1